jgi:hypothetical protein
LLSGCKDLAKNPPAEYVDRKAVFPAGITSRRANPLTLVVEITEDGRLSLNKIKTGSIADPALLSEKLKVIFEDREKASIKEREVLIDLQGQVRKEDLEKLVETLASVKASPIKVIKNNLQEMI